MSKLRVKCPSCATLLQIASKHQGAKIRCPKCSKPFVAGSKPQSVAVQENPLDELDLSDVGAPPPQAAAGSADGGFWNAAAQQQSAPTPVQKPAKKKKIAEEMTESDSQFIGSALMMLLFPILATILPFFGFQLKRLASAGEYAPLGAGILVSLVGGGLVGYARRRSGDSLLAGGGFFALALFIGIAGFALQKATLTDDDVAADTDNRRIAGGPNLPSQQPPINPGALELPPPLPTQNSLPSVPQQPATGNTTTAPKGKNRAGSSSGESSTIEFGNDAASDRQQRMDDGRKVRQNNSDSMMKCARASGEAQVAYSRARMRGQDFGQQYQFIAQVGNNSKSGRLFVTENPVEAVCAYEFGLRFAFMPISSSQDEYEHRIVPPASTQLVGFNFSTRDGKLVGIQGLFGSFENSQPSDLVEGEWVGVKTNELGQSICPQPNSGFVQFLEANEIVGFAWVVKR